LADGLHVEISDHVPGDSICALADSLGSRLLSPEFEHLLSAEFPKLFLRL